MIPKIIHYCWFGGNPLPKLAEKCIASWRKYCPDYEIKLWNEENIDLTSVAYMKEAYEAKAWGFVPDVARLQIIYENGGIYLDTDVEIIKPLDTLLDNSAFVGLEDDKYIALGLGFGAEKGNEVIKMLLDKYKDMHFLLDNGTYNKTAAPKYQTQFFYEIGFKPSENIVRLNDVTIYPSEYFCPLNPRTSRLRITKNSYTIHQYMASWTDWETKLILKITRTVCTNGKLGYLFGRAMIFGVRVIRKTHNCSKKAAQRLQRK